MPRGVARRARPRRPPAPVRREPRPGGARRAATDRRPSRRRPRRAPDGAAAERVEASASADGGAGGRARPGGQGRVRAARRARDAAGRARPRRRRARPPRPTARRAELAALDVGPRPPAARAQAVVLAPENLIAGLGRAADRLRQDAPAALAVRRRCGASRGRLRGTADARRRQSAGKESAQAPAASGPAPILRPSREHPRLRPSARPLRVLAARRRVQDRRPRRARRGVRPARAGPHRPRRDERRGRALQGRQEARHQADRRLRDLLRRRPRRPPRRAAASSATTSRCWPPPTTGYRNLVKLSSAGFLEGLHRGKPTVDMAQLERHGEGLIALTGCLASRFCQRLVDGRDAEARAHADDLLQALRRRQRLLRGPEERHRRPGQGQRGHRPDRARGRPPARRHRRRALPAPRGLPPPHGAAVRADEVDARRAEDDLRHERVLPALQRGDGAGVRRVARGDRRRRSRSPSAATSRSSSAGS